MPHKVCASGTLMAGKNRLVNGVQNTLCTNFFANFSQEWSLPATLLHTTMQHPTSLWGFLSQPPCYPLQPTHPPVPLCRRRTMHWGQLVTALPLLVGSRDRQEASISQTKSNLVCKKVLKFWEPCQVGLKLVWYLVRSHVSTAICLMKLTSLI